MLNRAIRVIFHPQPFNKTVPYRSSKRFNTTKPLSWYGALHLFFHNLSLSIDGTPRCGWQTGHQNPSHSFQFNDSTTPSHIGVLNDSTPPSHFPDTSTLPQLQYYQTFIPPYDQPFPAQALPHRYIENRHIVKSTPYI